MEAPLLVHHARVVGSAATRGDVERWLDGVPVEGLGVGKDELFYVPRLRMRVPERGGVAATQMPDRILAALRHLLAGAEIGWGRAFRPDRPYRFTSRSTHFAWLIRLWIGDGSVAAKDAFRRATGQESLVAWQRATLLRDGPALVTTIARLAEIGIAARWIASLESSHIALAYRAIETSFALSLATPPTAQHEGQPTDKPRVGTMATAELSSFLREMVTWLVEHGNDWYAMPAPARVLLLSSAAVARKPAIATLEPEAVATIIDTLAVLPELLASGRGVDAVKSPAPARARVRRHHDAESQQPPMPRQIPPSTLQPIASVDRAVDIGRTVRAPGQIAARPSAAIEQQFPPKAENAAERPITIRQAVLPATLLAPDIRLSTEFGGLLFLVNAFVALGLYPDFTEPRGRRLEPSPLWLADRIGRYWFGARYRRDPLANWIAAHVDGGRLPLRWRIEHDWLAGFETSVRGLLTRHRRHATFWHPAGFPLFDGDERNLRPRERRARQAPRPPARLPLIERWSACLALYLNVRLEHVTGSGLALLAQPARVETRDLDLQAVFSLDRHPIELRLAGLDRNPGWQPAEARSIAFAFE